MSEEQKKIGITCLLAYKRLMNECLRFQASELYLAKLELEAVTVEGPTRKAHKQFLQRISPEYKSPNDFFLERSFVMLIASFEFFLQELVHVIVAAFPKKVGRVEFKLTEILDATSSDELVRRSIETTLNSLMYKKPAEYLAGISELLSIDPSPLRKNWTTFVEAKARRDVGVHNGWKCNEIYLRKIAEAGIATTYTIGTRLLPPKDKYFDEVCEALSTLAEMMLDSVFDKHKSILNLPPKNSVISRNIPKNTKYQKLV